MNAYDITTRIRTLIASLEASGGEADDTTEADLEALLGQAEHKVEAVVYTIQRLDIEAKAERELEDLHKRRRAAAERAQERVRGLLLELVQGHLALTGEGKVKTAHGTAYIITSSRVDGPEDPAAWPEGYRRTKLVVSADREAAKAALKAGASLPGLALVESVSVGVRK